MAKKWMKIIFSIIFVLAIILITIPISIKTYVNWYIKDNYKNKVHYWSATNEFLPSNGIVFVGDSITENFLLNEYFYGKNILNRGIYGDTTIGVLNRMSESVYDLSPSKVFLLIGTNDLDKTNDSPKIISERIKEIIQNIKINCPDTIIYLQSIYPVNNSKDSKINKTDIGKRNNKIIKELNQYIQELYDDTSVIYIDVYSQLIDDNDNLGLSFTLEGLHLTSDGYQKVVETLIPYIEN